MIKKDRLIMIVDDDEVLRFLVRSMLECEGYSNFIEADGGVSAYEILQAQNVHLIICDWNMLPMTGLEFLIKIRANQKICPIPFIMMSGGESETKMSQAFKSGANAFITKPFNFNQLTSTVSSLMQQSNKQ